MYDNVPVCAVWFAFVNSNLPLFVATVTSDIVDPLIPYETTLPLLCKLFPWYISINPVSLLYCLYVIFPFPELSKILYPKVVLSKFNVKLLGNLDMRPSLLDNVTLFVDKVN